MTEARDRDDRQLTAVVLSGGGANGAYEVGILKALCSGQSPVTNYEPLEPDIFAGTSIGSFNAAFLVSQWDRYGPAAVGNLERFWMERLAGGWHTNGIFRIRGNPTEYLDYAELVANPLAQLQRSLTDFGHLGWEGLQRGVHFVTGDSESFENRLVQMINFSSFVSTSPMRRMLKDIDYQAIRRSNKWLKIAATNWATGELKMFWNHDMTDNFGPLAIQSSAAIPGVFPPIELGSQPYVDGSVLLNTPLSPAINAGAEILHVMYLDPDIKNIPFADLRNTCDSFLRMMQIQWANAFNDDIGDAALINRGLDLIDRAKRGEPLSDVSMDVVRAFGDLERFAEGKYRPLTIYRYHPQDPLEGDLSFLNFDRDRIEKLIERGYQDAVYHDFKESEDIFPGGEQRRPNPRRVIPRQS